MSLFYITGVPRSRTAWFAAFMTASGFPCLHEGVIGCRTLAEYKSKIEHISDSTTGLGILEKYYDRPTLAITGRSDRAATFAGCDVEYMKELERAQINLAQLTVPFDQIDARIEEIFLFLTGQPINLDIYSLFKTLTITSHVEFDYVALH